MTRSEGAALAASSAEKGALKKLKPGPGLSRDAVAMDQKLRLRAALSALAAESGYEAVTVRSLIRRASVSTSTFYNHYDSVEDCLASIVGVTTQMLVGEMRAGQQLAADPLCGLRSGLRRLMERVAEEPETAQVVFIEAYGAGPRVRAEFEAGLTALETLFAEIFRLAPRPVAGTTHLASGVVAGIVGTVRMTARTGRAEELPGLSDALTDWMLSVANEEVVAFFLLRSRSVDGGVGGRLPEMGAVSELRESVADASRRAIMTTARLAAANGLSGLTSAKIRKDAGLSRREFARYFSGVEDCFLDAVESVATMAASAAETSAAGVTNWERRTYRALSALCLLAAGDRGLSRLVLLDVTAPGRAGLLRREEMIDRAAARLCDQAPPERRPSELAAEASISAIWRIAETEVAAGRAKQLPRLAPVFAYLILATSRSIEQPLVPETHETTFAVKAVSAPTPEVQAA